MPDSFDAFLDDLNRRYPVDERFRRNIRPLVERIFDRSISLEERKRLLQLVEKTYRRQVETRENLERAKEGIQRIFANLYKKILKDLGPEARHLENRRAEGEPGAGLPPAGPSLPHVADGAAAGPPPAADFDPGVPPAPPPGDPVWSEYGEDDALPETAGLPSGRDILFGEFLIRRGVLDRAALLGALEDQVREKPLLGWVALRRGVLSEEQVLRVLTRQVREERRFGDIAVEEGFLDADAMEGLRRVQKKYTPRLGRILIRRGDLSPEALAYFLEEFAAEHGAAG
ncbi:MAG: hypothetical protein JXQ29_05480 [Planctomycetes bacterium]|nr:hypothetical protein [Planctomycetota bacterium]